MAPLTWKFLLGTTTLVNGQHCSATDSCEDQTALLQSHLASHKSSLANAETQGHMLNFPKMATLADPSKRKTALAQFEHTALELAQNSAGVTPEVVEVCRVTTELLTDTVLAAISSEHATDQATLNSANAAFAVVEGERASYQTEIENAVVAVGIEWNAVSGAWEKTNAGLCTEVPECRVTESASCVDCGECHQTCQIHTERCENLASRLEQAHADVINTVTIPAFCEGDPGVIHPPSTHTYATQVDMQDHLNNKRDMEIYIALIQELVNCTDPDVDPCEECPPLPAHPPIPSICNDHGGDTVTCDTKTTELFAAQCQARFTVGNQLALYQAAFTARLGRFNQVRTQVMIMEADRKVEWDTLERVICLLNVLTVDEDGAAASATSEARINACRTDEIPEAADGVRAIGAHTGHLDIQYPVPPDMGDLPAVPPSPCDQDFIDICMPEGLPAACDGITEFETMLGGGGSDIVCDCSAPDADLV